MYSHPPRRYSQQYWREGKPISLSIKSLDGRMYTYQGYQSDSLSKVRSFLAGKLYTDPATIRLVNAGRVLDNKDTLSQNNVENNSTLFFVLALNDASIDFNPNDMANYLCPPSDYRLEKLKQALNKGSLNNRIYSIEGKEEAKGFMPTYYTKPLMYAKEPYYCPYGWRRYGLYVGLTKSEFSEKYQDWPVCYHGTSHSAALEIIFRGFRSFNNASCWISEGDKAVFVTPSIVYAGHPRYAKIKKHQGLYIQIVLQLRIRADKITKNPGTLENTFASTEKQVDQNYSNKELEWVFVWNNSQLIKPQDGIVVYGIMARITHTNPRFLKGNQWWEESRARLKWDSYEQQQ